MYNQIYKSKNAAFKDRLGLNEHLSRLVGKKVKVHYLTPDNTNEINGQLLKVGNDFLSVKLATEPPSTEIFKTDKIIKITVIYE